MVPENNNYNTMNYEIIKKPNTNNGNVKESIKSTSGNNQFLKQKNQQSVEPFGSPIKNSNVSLGLMKIPCLEWKKDTNKGTKTAEFYCILSQKKECFGRNVYCQKTK